MNNVYCAKIWQFDTGFTNQIAGIVTSIIFAYQQGKKIVIIDKFYGNHVTETSGVCISKIFDLDKINDHMSKKYDIIVFDRYNIDFRIKHVSYGYDDHVYDVTNIIKYFFCTDNVLHIPKTLEMNTLNGDPCLGVKKRLTIEYSINNYNFIEIFDEILKEDIIFDLSRDTQFKRTFRWMDQLDRTIFRDILSNIQYNPTYHTISENFMKTIINPQEPGASLAAGPAINKINVLHLRLEHDAVRHWSKMNHMDELFFKKYIENKYIELIRTHIDKSDENIILSYSTDNPVIDFLKTEGYKYCFREKNNDGREINALIDFLIATNCNNIFIGNYHPQKLNGSTYSCYISVKLPTNVKQILLDPDHITNPPSLIFY